MNKRAVALAVVVVSLFTIPSFAQYGHRRGDPGNPGVGSDGPNNDTWLSRTVTLSGAVRGASNQGVANVRLELRDFTSGSAVVAGYTKPNGTFEFDEVPRGKYELVATIGLNEARERVELSLGDNNVQLHMPDVTSDAGDAQTVSIAQMKVPGKARNELRKAQDLLAKNRTAEARKELSKALDSYPNFAEAHMMLGVANLQDAKFDDAVSELETSIRLDPNSGMAYVALGAAYNSLGRFDDAARALGNGTRLQPNSWQAYFESSRADLGQGDFAAALREAVRAEQLYGREFTPIHLVKAHALLGLKSYPQAVSELEQFLKGEPQGPAAVEARQTLDQAKAFVENK